MAWSIFAFGCRAIRTAIDEPISVLYGHEQGFTGHTDRLPNRHLRRLSNRILGSTFRASEQVHARYIRPIRQGRQPRHTVSVSAPCRDEELQQRDRMGLRLPVARADLLIEANALALD
jgi:hypothetical protein